MSPYPTPGPGAPHPGAPPGSSGGPPPPPPAPAPLPPPAPPSLPPQPAGPSATAGGARLVAAMEHVDRVVAAFLEDIGRAVASVRAEVASERDASLQMVHAAAEAVRGDAARLAADRDDFERHRAHQEQELERRWNELRAEQERDKVERARVEREIRDASQRAAAETQAAALVHLQAAQAAQAQAYGLPSGAGGIPGMMPGMGPAGMSGMPGMSGPAGMPGMPGMSGLAGTGTMGGYAPGAFGDLDAPGFIPLASGMVGFPEGFDPYAQPGPGMGPGPGAGGTMGPGPGSFRRGSPADDASSSAGPSLVFAVGGLQRANSPLWTAEVFEAEHNAWRLLPEMSTARGYLGVAHGGRDAGPTLLAVGGSDGRSTLSTAEEFNYAAGTWREVASMSRPRIWLAAASVGECTYAVGGYDGAEYLDLVEVYSPGPPDAKPGSLAAAGSWRKCKPLSAGRSTMGLAACQGTLYAVGGFAAPHYLATVEAYDPRANQWWGCAPLAAPRRDLGLAAVEHRNTLVCAGGYDGNAYLGVVEGFDPRTNNWRALAPLRRPRQLLGLCAKGDSVFALGGFDGKETVRTVEVYDVRADRWREAPPMSTPRLGLGVCCA